MQDNPFPPYQGPPPEHTAPKPEAEQEDTSVLMIDAVQDQVEEAESRDTKSSMKDILSTILLFLAAPLLALILILFVIQSYEVDGPSMQETLHNKDLLIVNKTPRTWAKITHGHYIPPRHEIIIFVQDETLNGGESRQLVKRVIGLPGERVVVQDGKVTVFNQEHPDGFNPDANQDYSNTITDTPGNVDVVVPEGSIFAMGDNRHNSLDSRYFGPISADQIVGKLGVRIFPLNKARSF